MSPLPARTSAISAEVSTGNSLRSQEESVSDVETRVSFFWKRDKGKSATPEEKSSTLIVESAIPFEKSPSSDFVELRINAADIEAASAEGTTEVVVDVVPWTINSSIKSGINASALRDRQEPQTGKKRKRRSKKCSVVMLLFPHPLITALVCVRR